MFPNMHFKLKAVAVDDNGNEQEVDLQIDPEYTSSVPNEDGSIAVEGTCLMEQLTFNFVSRKPFRPFQ